MINIIVVLAMSVVPMVDWAAHAGGLLGGLLTGALLFASGLAAERRAQVRIAAASVTAGFALVFSLWALLIAEPDPGLGDLCTAVRESYPQHNC